MCKTYFTTSVIAHFALSTIVAVITYYTMRTKLNPPLFVRSAPRLSRTFATQSEQVIEDVPLVVQQSLRILSQKETVLKTVSSDDYIRKLDSFYGASVGGHIRHSLDHFQRLADAMDNPGKLVDYDERKRNTLIESDKTAALFAIGVLSRKLPAVDINKEIEVSFMGDDKTFKAYIMKSSFSRELSFVSHHAVHHLSMVRLMMNSMHYTLPDSQTIGIAVSTVKDKLGSKV